MVTPSFNLCLLKAKGQIERVSLISVFFLFFLFLLLFLFPASTVWKQTALPLSLENSLCMRHLGNAAALRCAPVLSKLREWWNHLKLTITSLLSFIPDFLRNSINLKSCETVDMVWTVSANFVLKCHCVSVYQLNESCYIYSHRYFLIK